MKRYGMVGNYIFLILILLANIQEILTYNRKPCPRRIARQFQLPDCYVPDIDQSLQLSSASFLLSHNSGTGYLSLTDNAVVSAISSYGKNQYGTAYDQLQNGARALDLRPFMLSNGTVILHHGEVLLPVSLEKFVSDVIKWCNENPDELILIFHSNLFHESSEDAANYLGLQEMKNVYTKLGVNYVDCGSVYGLTVGDTLELAKLSNSNGYVLALDWQDYYGSFCGKMNWFESELVTCYPYPSFISSEKKDFTQVRCTEQKRSEEPMKSLKSYILESANNDPTDDKWELGPPEDLYSYPFNEIQALWQVDAYSIQKGLTHFSNLLDDNKKSRINEEIVEMVYNEEFRSISLLAIDNVALNGNALLSVLRNQCGQSVLEECGNQIRHPRISHKGASTMSFVATVSIYLAAIIWMAFVVSDARRLKRRDSTPEPNPLYELNIL